MDEDEAREVPEVEKRINAWRQSERKVMIDTIQDLKKQVRESEEQRARESMSRNYPLIGYRRPGEKKAGDAETAEDDESSETVQATEPEDSKETVAGTG